LTVYGVAQWGVRADTVGGGAGGTAGRALPSVGSKVISVVLRAQHYTALLEKDRRPTQMYGLNPAVVP
jgi:hypothetical protein